jgi:DNA-binding MarR family transcriptional regulator
MVAVLDELEAHGLAERRPDPDDRRKRSIHLTPEGHGKLKEMRVVARQVGEESFAALTHDERATLLHLLRKLAGFNDDGA